MINKNADLIPLSLSIWRHASKQASAVLIHVFYYQNNFIIVPWVGNSFLPPVYFFILHFASCRRDWISTAAIRYAFVLFIDAVFGGVQNTSLRCSPVERDDADHFTPDWIEL